MTPFEKKTKKDNTRYKNTLFKVAKMIIYSDLKMSYLWLVVHVWICKKTKANSDYK